MALKNPFDVQHRKNVVVYQQMIDAIFAKYAGEMAKVGASIKGVDPKKVFSFADYPMTNNRVKMLLKKMSSEMTTTILNGVEHEWTLANNKNNELCRVVFGDNIGKLTQEQYRRYFKTNYDAMEAFQKRRDAGLKLSDRVWNYTNQFKDEIEYGLDLGIRNGQDAASMAKDLKQYLKYPDKLFRRVRDVHGKLVLSKAAKAFHPSRGVYRSSFKNARRLAATETNIAYRSADYERWNDLDFVVGIRVQTSQNHGELDICDMLAGDYPKDFKFVGWHPLCRCNATAILKTKDELMDDLNDDEERGSVNAVLDVPQGFKDYVEANSQRIAKTPKLPYFLRDNGKRDENGRYILKPLGQNVSVRNAKPTALDIAKQRHANRKPEQVKAIKDAWKDRRDTITEGNRLLALFRGIDIDGESYAKLERSLNHGNYAAAKTNIAALTDVETRVNSLTRLADPWDAARQFGVSAAEATNRAVERTLSTWGSGSDLSYVKGKLEFEIGWVEREKRYPTWKIAQDAYKKRLKEVEQELIRKERNDLLTRAKDVFKVTSPTAKIKSLKAGFDLLTATPNWDLATAKDMLEKAVIEVDKLNASREAKRIAKVLKGTGASSVPHETLEELAARLGDDTPKTLENLKPLIDSRRADLAKKFGEATLQKAEAFIQQMMDAGDYGMNVPRVSRRGRGTDDVIDNIFSSWFKCQQETGTGNGMVDVDARKRASRDLFGTNIRTTKNNEYEKYGFLMDKDMVKQASSGIANQYWNYGDGIQIRFKRDKVIATMTTTDSLSSGLYPCLTTDAKATAIERSHIKDYADALGKVDPTDIVACTKKFTWLYHELQYHGMLTLDCIDSVYIPKDVIPKLRKTALEKIKAVGCKVFTESGGVAVPVDWDAIL